MWAAALRMVCGWRGPEIGGFCWGPESGTFLHTLAVPTHTALHDCWKGTSGHYIGVSSLQLMSTPLISPCPLPAMAHGVNRGVCMCSNQVPASQPLQKVP